MTRFRTETIGDATLILGDCREVLPTLPRVDAVVTDPPYGVRDDDWDDMSEREFARLSAWWMSEAVRLAPELLAFGYVNSAVHKLCEMLYPQTRTLLWAKPPGSELSGASSRKRWFAYEAIFHGHAQESWSVVEPRDVDVGRQIKLAREAAGLSRGAVDVIIRGKKTGLCYRWEEGACLPTDEQVSALRRALPQLNGAFDAALESALQVKTDTLIAARAAAAERSAEASDVLIYRTVTSGRHPCEKPLALMEDLLGTTGEAWSSCLDPFMGSGTTGVAAAKLGRSFIGIEREPKYFDIACRRIEEAWKQPRLFDEPRAKPVQEALIFD